MSACSENKPATVTVSSSKVDPLIALMTDFGSVDTFVGEMKGSILSHCPQARILDLTHDIEVFNIRKGAYHLNVTATSFPKGTIFVAVVDPGVGGPRQPVLLLTKAGKYFIGPDNGLFGLVAAREGIDKIYALDKIKYYREGVPSTTFHGRDIFGPVAGHLASGVPVDELGTPIKRLEPLAVNAPQSSGIIISGEVLHVDRYGNVITNIPGNFSPHLKVGVLMRITVGTQTINAPLLQTYGTVPVGRPVLVINSQGFVELSVNQGSAAKQYKIQSGMPLSMRP